MKILFLHNNAPGQFINLLNHYSDKAELVFVSFYGTIQGVGNKKRHLKLRPPNNLSSLKGLVESGYIFLNGMQKLKQEGFYPTHIISHSGWGCGLFAKEVFPKAKLISYVEWYFSYSCELYQFSESDKHLNHDKKIRLSHIERNLASLKEISEADFIVSPSKWQLNQLTRHTPDFICKSRVIYDGVDTSYFRPNDAWKTRLNKPLITYATRGLEPMRGFVEFISCIPQVLEEVRDAEIMIAGEDKVHYGHSMKEITSYREWALAKLGPKTRNKVHFVGKLPRAEYARLLKASTLHVYLTRPFVLSWSFFDSLATGCSLVCSEVAPVMEVIDTDSLLTDCLVDHRCIDSLSDKIINSYNDKEGLQLKSQRSRSLAVNKYDLKCALNNWSKLIS